MCSLGQWGLNPAVLVELVNTSKTVNERAVYHTPSTLKNRDRNENAFSKQIGRSDMSADLGDRRAREDFVDRWLS
jgi:hypothetical protein